MRQLRTVAGERTHSDDAFDRLTLVVGAGDTGHDRFVYDLAGNRLQDTSWTYQVEGGTNRLRYRTHRNEACSFEYRYDVRGNETSVQRVVGTPSCSTMEERTQTYDPENRLVETRRYLSTGTATAVQDRVFWYDALGRRILMRSTNDAASDNGTWRYFWFGDHVGVKTWNPNDSSLVDLWWPSLQRGSSRGEWFIYGPGVDNLLGSLVFRGKYGHDVRYVFEQDYRGSVRAVQDGSGRAVPGLDGGGFGAFGTPAGARTEALAGFNGAEHAGGLVYMRNRWYDPNTGRFTQEDPIGFAGGSNLYAYAGNDPVSYSDPYGLCPPVEDCLRQGSDVAAGMTPGLSTVLDAVTVVTGRNLVTGEKVGTGGRVLALAGLVTPASGGELRGVGKIVAGLTERFGAPVTRALKNGASQLEWTNGRNGVK